MSLRVIKIQNLVLILIAISLLAVSYLIGRTHGYSRAASSEANVGDFRPQAAFDSTEMDAEQFAALGREHYGLGEYLLSAEAFAKATVLEPENSRFHNDAGYSFWKCKDYGSALGHLETAVRLSPSKLRYANNLAILYVDTDRDAEALPLLVNAHQDEADANYNLGYIYLKRKRRDEAIRQMETALSFKPDLERAKLWLGRLESEVEPDELNAAYLVP